MLQRIQSIYLLLAGVVIFALFFFPLVHNVYIEGRPVTIMVTGVFQDVNGVQTHTVFFSAITVVTGLVSAIPLVIIFMFRNRKQQIALCYSAILVIIGFSFWMSQTVKQTMGIVQIDFSNWGIGMFLTAVSILFIVLAVKAIQKDEKLVKSADRLR